MSDLAALADRVEQAEGPSRELDAEIKHTLGLPWDYAAYWGSRGNDKPVAHAYTASLDAAMMLAPEGWFWETGNQTCSILGEAMLHKPEWVNGRTKLKFARGRGKTPALALVAAALRAKGSHNHDD